jgi:hypothetical protein
MTGYDDFETRLELALRRYGDQALLPFDAEMIAERAMDGPRPRSAWRALLVPALLLALLLVAAGIITLTRPDPGPLPEGLLHSSAGQGHAAVALADGRILVLAGSWEGMGRLVSSTAEIWDPAHGTSTAVTARMTTDRLHASALTLRDGRVLITGGFGGPHAYASSAVASAELWDAANSTFVPTGEMIHARVEHQLSLLPDGRVLVNGGAGPEGLVADAEIYDPATGRFSSAGALDTPRSGHTATVLEDGRVLVVGGTSPEGMALASAEIWDPRTMTFEAAGDLAKARAGHTATLLADGQVLLVGGYAGTGYQVDGSGIRQRVLNVEPDFPAKFVAEAEVWDPATGFAPAGALTTGRTAHTATLLPDGRVAIIGGLTGLEDDGSIYLETLASVEIWNPQTRAFSPGQSLTEARADHSAIAAAGGGVVILGGTAGSDELASVAVWSYSPGR